MRTREEIENNLRKPSTNAFAILAELLLDTRELLLQEQEDRQNQKAMITAKIQEIKIELLPQLMRGMQEASNAIISSFPLQPIPQILTEEVLPPDCFMTKEESNNTLRESTEIE